LFCVTLQRESNSQQILIGDSLVLKMTFVLSVHCHRISICERGDTSDFNSFSEQYDSASDRNNPRVSSHLHLSLSPIVSANFAHRPNVRLGFPRFGKLAIPIVHPRLSTLLEEVSVFQNAMRASVSICYWRWSNLRR